MKTVVFLSIFLLWTCTAQAKGKIQNGLYKIYRGNAIWNLATSKKVALNGVAFAYYKNGDIQRQSWYENNQLHGPTKIFSADKKLIAVKVYDRGQLAEVRTGSEATEPLQ